MRYVTLIAVLAICLYTSCNSQSKSDKNSSSPHSPIVKDQAKILEENVKKVDDEAVLVRNHISALYDKANIHVYQSFGNLRGEALRDQHRVVSLKRVLMVGNLDPKMKEEIVKWENEYLKRWEYAEHAKKELEDFKQTGQWKTPAETPSLDSSQLVIPATTPPPSQISRPQPPEPPARSPSPKPQPVTDFNPIGKTELELTEKWGPPTGRMELGSELQLIFPQGRVTIENEKVTSLKANE